MRLHAVVGGTGPPLLLVHGWPQTWYAWRMLIPTLARDFEVIAEELLAALTEFLAPYRESAS